MDPALARIAGLDDSDTDAFRKQIEAGNITAGDLQILNQIGDVYQYPRNGMLAGATGGGAFVAYRHYAVPTRPPPANGRVLGIVLAGSLVGGLVGVFRATRVYDKGLDQMEDPKRFSQALKEIFKEKFKRMQARRDARASKLPSQRPIPPRTVDQDNGHVDTPEVPQDGWSDSASVQCDTQNGQVAQNGEAASIAKQAKSRWDEIRGEANTAKPTSWDTLRQAYEKRKLPQSSNSPTNSNSTSSNDISQQEEQAKFDALIEAERQANAETKDAYGANFGDREVGSAGSGRPGKRW